LSARWNYFDFEAGVMTIPRTNTKSGRSLILPIPQRALPLLMALPSRGKSEFLFPGTGKSGHLADARSGWERVREKAKVEDVTIHDLRRTAASWVTRRTGDLQVTQKMLNHKRIASTEIYARLLLGPLRDALENHTGVILEKLGTPEVA
jgi:integrase